MSRPHETAFDVPADRSPTHEEAIAYLTARVLPALEDSRAALARDGVTATIEASWEDPASSAEPQLRFSCGERGVPSASTLPVGEAVHFAFSDGMLHVVAFAGERTAVPNGGEEQAIQDAVKRAVSTYYAKLEDSVR